MSPAGEAGRRGQGRRYLGIAVYVLAPVQFVAGLAVAAARYGPPPYSPLGVTISDLQAVGCGAFQGAYVCSPLHSLANLSVAVLGILIVIGTVLLRPYIPDGGRRGLGVFLLVVAGGAAFANAFTPEDVTLQGDQLTALVAFLAANFGLIQVGRVMPTDPRWRRFSRVTTALGVIGVAALVLSGTGVAALVGQGGIEWMILAPVLVWTPALGVRLALHGDP